MGGGMGGGLSGLIAGLRTGAESKMLQSGHSFAIPTVYQADDAHRPLIC